MKSLLEKLLKINLSTELDQYRPRSKGLADLADFGKPAVLLAHGNKKAIWWYNLYSHKLDYSETATGHKNLKAFSKVYAGYPQDKDPNLEELTRKGWIRGRVFEQTGKCYLVIYLGSDKFTWIAAPVDRNLLSQSIGDLYNQIQNNFKEPISDVVDEDSRTLLEIKKK